MAIHGDILQGSAVVKHLGPFLDFEDGVTPETGLATAMNHATTGVRISKNSGAFTARNTLTIPTYDSHGYYLIPLDAVDTATLGTLKLIYADPTTTLQCEADFDILPANVYNAKYGTGYLDVAVAEMANIDFGVLQKASLNASTPASVQNIAANGSGFTAIGDTRLANLDATISSRTKPADTQAAVTTVATTTNVTNPVTITSNADITSILADTNELQGLISSSKINAQVKGVDANAITASALATDAVSEITAAIWAKVVDGTITFEKALKLTIAFIAGNFTWDGSVLTVKDQAGATIFTKTITDTAGTGVIS